MMKIILGSASKYRAQILRELGYEFEVQIPDFDEKSIRSRDPIELAQKLARGKAESLLPKISDDSILITADTIGWCNGILEKPVSEKEAREFYKRYEDNSVKMVTAIAVASPGKGIVCESDLVEIIFNKFSEDHILESLQNGEAYNCAGGFTLVNSRTMFFVRELSGSKETAIGLPCELLKKLLSKYV